MCERVKPDILVGLYSGLFSVTCVAAPRILTYLLVLRLHVDTRREYEDTGDSQGDCPGHHSNGSTGGITGCEGT
jgi:hypothetical protein